MKQRIMLVVFIALSGTTGVSAQTQEGRQACMNDAFQFCQDAIPDRERVFRCLESHQDVISAACRSVVAPSPAANQPAVKEQASRAKSRRAFKASKASKISRASKVSRASKGSKISKPSKVAKASKVSKPFKAASRRDRKPLNIAPR